MHDLTFQMEHDLEQLTLVSVVLDFPIPGHFVHRHHDFLSHGQGHHKLIAHNVSHIRRKPAFEVFD